MNDIIGVVEGFFFFFWLWLKFLFLGLFLFIFLILFVFCIFWYREFDVLGLGFFFLRIFIDGIFVVLERVFNDLNVLEVLDVISECIGCDNNDDEVDDNEDNGWFIESFIVDEDNDNIDEVDGWFSDKFLEYDKLLSEVDSKGFLRKFVGCILFLDVGVRDNVLRETDKRGVGNDNDDDLGLYDNIEGYCRVVFKGFDSECDFIWLERLLRGIESIECWDDVWKRFRGDDIFVEVDNSFFGCDKLFRGVDNKDLFVNDIVVFVDGWFKFLV